jgi:cytidylate kinase
MIGISGKIGAGKSTLADYIIAAKPEYVRHSFAENVREVFHILTGIPITETRTAEAKNTIVSTFDLTIGEMLQKIGTCLREDLHRDTWIISAFASYTPGDLWIFDDIRFPNEADAIKAHGGIVIRLNGDPGGTRASTKRDLTHISETALDDYSDFDLIIDTNVTSVDDCYKLVKAL